MAIAFVQGTGVQSAGSVAYVEKAFASEVVSGNFVVVASSSYLIKTLTVTRSAGAATVGTVTADKRKDQGDSVGIDSCAITGAGTLTMRTTSGSSAYLVIAISEFSGVNNAAAVDDSNSSGSGSGGTDVHTGTIGTTAGDVLVGTCAYQADATTITEDATWTVIFEDETADSQDISMIYKLATSGDPGWTLGGKRTWASCGVSYKVAEAGGLSITATETLAFAESLD